ncbi:MAG: tyrosine-type recombinase/integrase, partial [Gammaproteobacteria bacterium]
GATRALMPLPQDVGRALCEYLKNGRPNSQSRRVFLRHNAPHVGFSRSGCISAIAKAAMHRACVDPPSKGAHIFRHTLATQMLTHGASLQQIGHVLRHRRLNTTRIYAKVDLGTLRSVALPWPGAVQ